MITPLILGPFGINLVEWPKGIFFRILIEIIFVFYLSLILFNKKYLPQKSLLLWALLAFYLIMFVASIFGINFYRSFFGDMQRGEGLILHLHLLAFFIILSGVFQKKEEWMQILKASAIIAGISSFAAVLQQLKVGTFYYIDPVRFSGTMSNPDLFACYIVVATFITIFILANENHRKLKILWSFLIILNCYTLFFSGTRGSWLGFFVGVVVIIFFNFLKLERKKRLLTLFVILALCSFLLLVFMNLEFFENLPGGHIIARISDINFAGRTSIWEPAVEAIKTKPLLGWGFESFAYVSDKYMKTGLIGGIYFDRPHNKILEILVYGGILGFLSYLAIFVVAFYSIFKLFGKNFSGSVCIAFFVSYFIQNIFAFDNIGTYMLFFIMASFVSFKEKNKEENFDSQKYNPSLAIKSVGVCVASLFLFWVMYEFNLKPTIAAMNFPRSIVYEKTDVKRAFEGYKKGISMKTVYDNDLILAFSDRSLYLLESGVGNSIKQEIMETLLQNKPVFYKNIKNKEPQINHLYGYITRINEWEYLLSGGKSDLDEMNEILIKAIEFNPNVPSFYQLKGEMLILQNNYEEGEKYIRQSCEVDPLDCGYGTEIYYRISSAYIKKNDIKKAVANLQKVLDIDYDYKKNNSTSAIKFADPGQFIDYVALLYYMQLGNIDSCIEVYKKASEVYPEYAQAFNQRIEAVIADSKSKKE